MANWKFWKGFLSGAVATILVIFALIEGAAKVKNLFTNPAKPQILNVQNCRFRPFDNVGGGIAARFELLVNNAGTKDCSIISIDLTWPNGFDTELFVLLPKTIPAGLTERVTIEGKSRLELQPDQTSAEATVTVIFNTKHIIRKKITFTIDEHL